ncbi:adult-specific rigid cuticular protein 11.9-like [Uloborus diversus]|uniref:adult-specific rigid cuticular protein 11.9-like n=1 Tax=Uloborus diversus TaxID=327109 RepID=UPI00240A25B7|nr:adult-specific rigid cuticular protein 11.9-like [Uloborus diversus]
MKFLVLSLLFGVAMCAEIGMNQAGDSYNFHYAAGDAGGHRRAESGHGKTVTGSYSYVDPNGHLRTVSYTAGPDGFKPSGDIGVDKKTAADAAAIAALAPKAPIPAAPPAAPVHHYYAPYYHGAGAWMHHDLPNYAHWGAFW